MKAPHPSHTFYYTTPLQLTVRILTIIHSQFIVSVDTKNSNPRCKINIIGPPELSKCTPTRKRVLTRTIDYVATFIKGIAA
ncbi:hypothetical protein [Rubritalea tangerina]|uniref:hypothetical protein n=1 Tax=Rubritalea tangerina TaxID=430798 RepID=UPI0036140D30